MLSVPTDDAFELPWPQCLGCFDEESCRFFLRQVGERIVPSYPFSLGMEEVYGLILEKYGLKGASDAISILQELLEDDEASAGLGDDGDVWRSWRHNWRHRNDDALNPFIPRVGNLVFCPPTAPRIRLLKAANFVSESNRPQISHGPLDSLEKVKVLLGGATHESLGSQSENKDDKEGLDSSPIPFTRARPGRLTKSHTVTHPDISLRPTASAQLKHVRRRSAVSEVSPPSSSRLGLQSLSGEQSSFPVTLGVVHQCAKAPACLRGGKAAESTVDSPCRLPLSHLQKTGECVSLETYRETHGIPVRENSCNSVGTRSLTKSSHRLPFHEKFFKSNHPTKPEVDSRQLTNCSSEVNTGLWQPATLCVSDISLNVDQPTTKTKQDAHLEKEDSKALDHNQRAANRQARLIDGALFNGDLTKEQTHDQFPEGERSVARADLKLSPQRLNLVAAHKRLSPSTNFLQGLWSRFRTLTSQRSSHTHQRNHSFPVCALRIANRSNSSSNLLQKRPTLSKPAIKQMAPQERFGLDGSCEARSPSRTGSDINKPLPLSPTQIVKRPVSNEAQQPSFTPPKNHARSSSNTSSISFSSRSKSSSRHEQRKSKASHNDPPSTQEVDNIVSQHQARRSDSPPLRRYSSVSFSEMANRNPFLGPSFPTTPIMSPQPVTEVKSQLSSGEWPVRIWSSIPFKNAKMNEETIKRCNTPLDVQSKATVLLGLGAETVDNDPQISPDRGRDVSRSKTPSPRSRSPVKRLLGLGKDSTPKGATTDTSLTPKQTPSRSNQKRSLKQWSYKLRHGFLSSYEGQLQQERMMEQHTDLSDIYIAQPAKANRSMFPVSLRPVDQARMLSEIELMISITGNKYLLHEAQVGRITAESVARIRARWEARNKPQVVEFLYDLATQRDLVIANLETVQFHGDAAHDPISLSSILHQWKIMTREMSPRTLCNPDSVVRRWLHDTRRVLEVLGASGSILEICYSLTISIQKSMHDKERERAQRRDGSGSTQPSSLHRRSASDNDCAQITYAMSPTALPTRSLDTERSRLLPNSLSLTHGMDNNHSALNSSTKYSDADRGYHLVQDKDIAADRHTPKDFHPPTSGLQYPMHINAEASENKIEPQFVAE